MEVKINIDELLDLKKELEIGNDGSINFFLANEIHRISDDYTPFDTGTLKNNSFVVGDTIFYPSPYANYLYQGLLMVDPFTGKGSFYDPITNRHWSRPNTQKVLSNRHLHYKGEPKRGSRWVERAIDDYSSELEEAVVTYIKRGMK